jgi:phosphoglycerate dehydrogenase-like enzyme
MTAILLNEPDGFPDEALAALKRAGDVHRADAPYPSELIEAVFIRLRDHIGAEFHVRHPALKHIVSPTTGLNHIDADYFSTMGVKVLSLQGHAAFLDTIHATAEHTLALTLGLIRRLPAAAQSVARGQWNRYAFKGSELHGKTVMLLGYGRVGRQVHALFEAFGCGIRAYDIDRSKVPAAIYADLEDGLGIADIVSVHIPLDKSTRGFLSALLLSRIKPGGILINTSRGEVVDQSAMFTMVDKGHLGGIALDVLVDEPTPVSREVLDIMNRHADRVIITPHIAGFTAESLRAVENFMTELFLSARHHR